MKTVIIETRNLWDDGEGNLFPTKPEVTILSVDSVENFVKVMKVVQEKVPEGWDYIVPDYDFGADTLIKVIPEGTDEREALIDVAIADAKATFESSPWLIESAYGREIHESSEKYGLNIYEENVVYDTLFTFVPSEQEPAYEDDDFDYELAEEIASGATIG